MRSERARWPAIVPEIPPAATTASRGHAPESATARFIALRVWGDGGRLRALMRRRVAARNASRGVVRGAGSTLRNRRRSAVGGRRRRGKRASDGSTGVALRSVPHTAAAYRWPRLFTRSHSADAFSAHQAAYTTHICTWGPVAPAMQHGGKVAAGAPPIKHWNGASVHLHGCTKPAAGPRVLGAALLAPS
jgi:hypothetical protein